MDLEFSTILRGHELRFFSTWGLFSPKSIDKGTALLLEQIELRGNENILDLGCGYGPIGISLAKETSGEVHMIDKDFVAIEYAQKNIQQNHIKKARAYLSNGFRDIEKSIHFDLVVSNVPAKVGKELLLQIIADTKTFLNPGGKFYIVCISGLKEFFKRELKASFGNVKKLKHGHGYACLMAEVTESPLDDALL